MIALFLLSMIYWVSAMPDTMCFPPSAGSASARPVVNRTTTVTERACKVACGDDVTCIAVSYIAPVCIHLGAVDNSRRCSKPAAEIYVKQNTGCSVRTNITGGIDNPADICISGFFPKDTVLTQKRICPRNARNYVIRGIDDVGNRVTLDNEIDNEIRFNTTRNLWRFYHAATGFTKFFTSVSCATSSGACACDPLPGVKPNIMGGVAVQIDAVGACAVAEHRLTYVGGKQKAGSGTTSLEAVIASSMTITCTAGIWLLTYTDNSNGWQIVNATCAP